MEPSILNDYRCDCGKLLFKGLLLSCKLEIKCKRCGAVKVFDVMERGVRSFMFVVDGEGVVVDACDGVTALKYSRQYVIGKSFFDILSLTRDTDGGRSLLNFSESKQYQIKSDTLCLRDRQVPIEIYVVPVDKDNRRLYCVFNTCRL